MSSRITGRLPQHGTLVAYVAIFLALGGTGLAATTGAISSAVTVHCSATSHGRRVSCKVLHGAGTPGPRGPQGPRGAIGPPGPSGSSGPLTLTQQPAYTLIQNGISNPLVGLNNQSTDPNGEWQKQNVYSYSRIATPATLTFRTPLLSPTELPGGAGHLASVDVCFGLQDSTLGPPQPAYLSISRVTVHQFTEPDGTSHSGPVPVYSPTNLIDAPLNLTSDATGDSSCQTVSAPSPASIAPGSYLALDLQISFSAPGTPDNKPFQGWLYLGRLSATYSP